MNGTTCKRSVILIFLLVSILLLCGCATNPISIDPVLTLPRGNLIEYPLSNDQVTGVAVSQQARIFVNFPRWDKDPLYSVAELKPDGTLIPYPGNDWNRWGIDEAGHPEAHFICVQSLTVDSDDFLWILDPASPGFKGVIPGGAKLVKINIETDIIERVIPFDDITAPATSYLNDVRIDNDGDFAYISDSGTGAIIVVDLSTGKSRRRLEAHPSTKAEPGYVPIIGGVELRDENGVVPQIHVDGIALDSTGKYLYYHALTARFLYRIKTSMLKDSALSDDQLAGYVEKVADTGAVDGMLMDSDDNLYLTGLEDNAIKRYRPVDDILETIVQDDSIQWPDSMAISPDHFLYFTASQIHRMPRFNYGKDERILPYYLYKISLERL
jgi:sugar lactone lactonase YvrE